MLITLNAVNSHSQQQCYDKL